MKPVIIIAVAVVFFVGAVFAIQSLNLDDNEVIGKVIMENEVIEDVISENKVISSLTFDCAKQWDKTTEHYNKIQKTQGNITYERSMKLVEESEEIGADFIKNRCASTVNDWAYRTLDENTVWNSGVDWQQMAEMEEKWHQENP